MVKQHDGTLRCNYDGTEKVLDSQKGIGETTRVLCDAGYYPYVATPEESEELLQNYDRARSLLVRLASERIRGWVQLLKKIAKERGTRFYIALGDEDLHEVNEVLSSSSSALDAEGKVVAIDEEHQMISIGASRNQSQRQDLNEEGWRAQIDKLASEVSEMKKAIFNLHIPPRNTAIDRALVRDKRQRLVVAGCNPVTIPAGSQAVREAIEKYQPMLGIHGHFDESRGVARIGRTVCVNPGSEYSSGVLRGLLCELEGSSVRSYVLTSG
jgi:Icc-related predicted phosphoesterase